MKLILKLLPIVVLSTTFVVHQFLTIWFGLNAASVLLVTVTIFAGLFLYHWADGFANELAVDSPPGKPRDKFTDPLFVVGYMNRMAVALEDQHKGHTTAKSRKYRTISSEALAEVWTRKRRFRTRLLWFAGFIIISQAEDSYGHKLASVERMLSFFGIWMVWILIVIPMLLSCVRRFDFSIERKLEVDTDHADDSDDADDAVESEEDSDVEIQRDLNELQWALASMKGFIQGFIGSLIGVGAVELVVHLYRVYAH